MCWEPQFTLRHSGLFASIVCWFQPALSLATSSLLAAAMAQPSMQPLLGRSASGGKRASTTGLIEAIVLMCAQPAKAAFALGGDLCCLSGCPNPRLPPAAAEC
jgi:hypothetical protein